MHVYIANIYIVYIARLTKLNCEHLLQVTDILSFGGGTLLPEIKILGYKSLVKLINVFRFLL